VNVDVATTGIVVVVVVVVANDGTNGGDPNVNVDGVAGIVLFSQHKQVKFSH